jgi:hypothetical protein
MHNYILIAFLSIGFASCNNGVEENPEVDNISEIEDSCEIGCSSFMHGTFEIPGAPGIISRKGSIQIETLNNLVDTFKVTRTSECEYFLTLTGTNDTLYARSPTDTMFVSITETTDSSYKYKSESMNYTLRGEMVKIAD